jgi:mono/diheme cytochrome c family protein
LVKRWVVIILVALGLGAVVVVVEFSQIKPDALQEPGHLETFLATRAKRFLVSRSSRDGIPPAPTNLQASIEEGDKLFGTECAMCHGLDGHQPTDTGRWMYPRASDLTSPEVQQYSDRELFWIVKNGIRLSGMPAFGRVESDEHIWNLVHYVRTLRASVHPESGGTTP